ncbi:hypothetical protein PIB30_056507 [Stylosanthes scabra]|uniref:Uncharacterized protein n=1 Tax=Stylosanthes scabra TaxID=79078 RepID=A0ABU6XJQ2_9FABA|nr:hypothetical protein [Stylosanthes scabra]
MILILCLYMFIGVNGLRKAYERLRKELEAKGSQEEAKNHETGHRVTSSVPGSVSECILLTPAQRAKFGAEVAKESARNEKIAKKSLKAKIQSLCVRTKGAYAYALPCLGRHVLAGTGPYAYAPKGSMRTHQ